MNNYTILVKTLKKGMKEPSFVYYEKQAETVKDAVSQINLKITESDCEITGMKIGTYQVLDCEPMEPAEV